MSKQPGGPKGIRDKELHQYTAADIRAALEHITGLPAPSPDAPGQADLWAQYEVAGNILFQMRVIRDPDAAKIEAIEYTLKNHAAPLDALAPHIERALGRKLHPDELASGMLYQ